MVGGDRRRGGFRSATLAVVAWACCTATQRAAAQISYVVSFQDPTGTYAAYYDRVASHALAAGDLWARHFAGTARLEVAILFDDAVLRAGGRSLAVSFLGNRDGLDLYEPGAIAEIRTGDDPNGAEADIELFFQPDYLDEVLWFDPSPADRVAPIPPERTDALSVFLHELGHAFGFNGWRDYSTGLLPGDYGSPFDALVRQRGGDFYFEGPGAALHYGGPVPLTADNLFHVGNAAPGPGTDLVADLMNGVVFQHQTRYDVSLLDRAMLGDMGVPLRPWASTADFNADGVVDGADLLVWQAGFGRASGAVSADGDADLDRDVDAADLRSWEAAFGVSALRAAAARGGPRGSAVPEPALLALLFPAALFGRRTRDASGRCGFSSIARQPRATLSSGRRQ